MSYKRPVQATLTRRLREPRRFLQVLAGPRQAGKTTLARQAMAEFDGPTWYASADAPGLEEQIWLEQQWLQARRLAQEASRGLLVLDEIQKVGGWSEIVKRLWDEDSLAGLELKVLLLGSAPLLLQRGLSESLAGRAAYLDLWPMTESEKAGRPSPGPWSDLLAARSLEEARALLPDRRAGTSWAARMIAGGPGWPAAAA